MDESMKEVEDALEEKWEQHMGHMKGLEGVKDLEEFYARERMKVSGGR
jgi:small subunit ribosomal protein S10